MWSLDLPRRFWHFRPRSGLCEGEAIETSWSHKHGNRPSLDVCSADDGFVDLCGDPVVRPGSGLSIAGHVEDLDDAEGDSGGWMQKELQEAGEFGFEFVGMTVAKTGMGGSEVVVITRRARH
jgi:hypothetical protein